MLIGSPPECPQCQCLINREHFSVETISERHQVTYLYCDFCSRGWETLWRRDATGMYAEQLTCNWDGKDRPAKLEEFLDRLGQHRAA